MEKINTFRAEDGCLVYGSFKYKKLALKFLIKVSNNIAIFIKLFVCLTVLSNTTAVSGYCCLCCFSLELQTAQTPGRTDTFHWQQFYLLLEYPTHG